MSDDSSDCSELDTAPSCSRERYQTRNNSDQKRKQSRIVMRIEFDDSDETSTSASSDDEVVSRSLNVQESEDLGDGGQSSCSQRLRARQNHHQNAHDEDDSDEFHFNAAQRRTRLGGRRRNPLDVGISDGSTSGSEVTGIKKTRTKSSKKFVMSDDEREPKSPENNSAKKSVSQQPVDELGFTSDSSSNDHLEKCPICLLSYRQQEIGSPSACQHIFCADCIEAWSKNVQTCPIDRLEFDRIIVRESYENRKIVREINVDPKAQKELILEISDDSEEEVTNCEICNRPDREDVMLLCDHCNQGYHMDCLSPPLSEVPEESWYCDNCMDSEDEADDVEEDLNQLYEDIRDMGIPEEQMRVREIHQPRILRTRQNERIRAAIMRHTRSNISRVQTTTTTLTTSSSSQRGRPRKTTTSTTTLRKTTNTNSSASKSVRKPKRKYKRRRKGRQRTYVVEYDVNNFDEKFAIKATKKVIRKRRRKTRSKKKTRSSVKGVRMTASKRLAEQLGVKPDATFTSHLSGSSAGLSLTGGANDLVYFSDSDSGGNIDSEIHFESGQGTAVQTSVRISNYGSQRSRKSLLLGRIKPNHIPEPVANRDNANTDILSSIMDMQDRWHSASRNLENVHINTDGTLNLPAGNARRETQSHIENTPINSNPRSSNDKKSPTNGPGQNDVTQAPMYSRGGGNANFNSGGGGGNYNNNRYGNNNQNNYRGGGSQYRASTGNTGGGGFNMGGRGNFNFTNSSNFSNHDQPPNSNFTPFRQWSFNSQRNQNDQNNQNNNQRNSLPFTNNQMGNNNLMQQQSTSQPQRQQNPFSGMPPQPCFPIPLGGTPRQSIGSTDDLFGGLPPPVTRQISTPVVLSVPPPPTPPAMMVPPTPALFSISNDYGRDDDSNCPNFSIYSQESLEVAKSSDAYPERLATAETANEAKEDDENEDLVQLDDDEEVPPVPPTQIDPSDLYEPENPTEEMDDDDEDVNNASDTENGDQENVKSEGEKNESDESDKESISGQENVETNTNTHNDRNDDCDFDNDKNDNKNVQDVNDENTVEDGEIVENDNDSGDEIAQKSKSNKEQDEMDSTGGTEKELNNEEEDQTVKNTSECRENLRNDDKSINTSDEDADIMSEKSLKATKDDGDDYDDDEDSDDNEDVTGKRPKTDHNSGKSLGGDDKSNDALSLGSSKDEESRGHTPTIPYNGRNSLQDSARSPSQANSDICDVTREGNAVTSGKNSGGNVIELYDDSDWDELNTDKTTTTKEKDNTLNKDVENNDEVEPDRSYTPCLDENNDPEIIETAPESPIVVENLSLTPEQTPKSNNDKPKETTKEILNETDIELIISEEEHTNNRKKRGGNLLDPLDDGKGAKFKKVKKRKKRNYRNDKPTQMTYRNRFIRRSFSRSMSRSVSRSRRRSRSRSRRRSISRSCSRSRSCSFNSFRSRSRSPRSRRQGRSHSRSSIRDKGRYGGRARGRSWDGGRIPRGKPKNKRRELARYDVRNVVGNKPIRDRYGRDTSRNKRSRSRSFSRRRSPFSRSPISRSRSRLRSRSRRRSFSRSPSRLRSRSRMRSVSKSRSKSISRSRTPSRSRNRRPSFSLSPSPQYNRRRTFSPPPRRFSPIRRRSISPRGRRSPIRRRSRSPIRSFRSRSLSPRPPQRVNGHKATHYIRNGSVPRNMSRDRIRSKSRSLSVSPRYTPQVNRMRSQSPPPKAKKKKTKDLRKKKSKRRLPNMSPSPNRRIARQPDSFADIEKPTKKKRRHAPKAKTPMEDHGWSPSPSPAPPVVASNVDYQQEKPVSWTPPVQSPILTEYAPNLRRTVSPAGRKEKSKRKKKTKKGVKRRVVRKEKKRKRRTETPEPMPSKEVFASGNNILVSVSFNKENTTNQHGQQTIVTLPPNREDLLPNRRVSIDHSNKRTTAAMKKQKEKRKKVDSKPVAIIDLERSPFQVEQEQADIIVLTDSEETRERAQSEHRCHRSESHSRDDEMESHRSQRQEADSSQRDKSPERLETIHEESYDLPQTGPKTPPEPPGIKFNMQPKKTNKVRNPLHEDDDYDMPSNSEQQQTQEAHHPDMDGMNAQSSQKIGPNTPPDSGPCSPDAYDPFEPTKSPSISPRSPTPPPSQMDISQNTMGESSADIGTTQKHSDAEIQRRDQLSGIVGSLAQGASINPIDLVMALMTSKSLVSSAQEMANKTNDSHQYSHNLGLHDDLFRSKHEEKSVTVLSNVLLNVGNGISSPIPPMHSKKVLPLPKITGSIGGSSSSGINIRNGGASNNADDAYTLMDADSPYSPGSDDYEDLFEPPPETTASKRYSSNRGTKNKNKAEIYDNLFGSTSPVLRLPSYIPSKKTAGATQASKTKAEIAITPVASSDSGSIPTQGGRSDHPKLYDDLPNNTALDLKERFMRKLNRQERVVEEVKLVLKPRFNRKQISKEDYKEIMRRAVPKICHSRSGEIDPHKIKNLIDAYVKKFRAKHKKLSLVSTGQVSSAVKCAAYLKKL